METIQFYGSVWKNPNTGEAAVIYQKGDGWVAEYKRGKIEMKNRLKLVRAIKKSGFTKYSGTTLL